MFDFLLVRTCVRVLLLDVYSTGPGSVRGIRKSVYKDGLGREVEVGMDDGNEERMDW